MDADINEHFHLIEQAIRDKLSEEDIGRLFKKVRQLIDELEGDGDETKHRNFRYKYHTQLACYLKAINRLSDAKKEEMLSKKYNTKETVATDVVLYTEEKIAKPAYSIVQNKDIETCKQHIDSVLQRIRPVREKATWEELKDHIQRLYTQSVMTSFVECLELQESFSMLKKVFDGCINELSVADTNSIPTDEVNACLEFGADIIALQKLCDHLQKQQLVEFARYLLTDSVNAYDRLFGDVSQTEDRINSRYKQLAKLFHPDSVAGSEVIGIFTELFQQIVRMKESKLEVLKKRSHDIGKANYYENEGKREWDIAIDFKNAAKSNFNLKVLKKESVQNWTTQELENAKIRHALNAFDHYRAAMLALGLHADLKTSVLLRKYMTVCLILAGPKYTTEIELYAIGTIYTIVNESETPNESDLKEMYRILDRVRNISQTHSDQTSTPKTENRNDSMTETSLELHLSEILKRCVPSRTRNITIGQRSKMKRDISNLIYDRCIVRADASIVTYYIAQDKILEVRQQAQSCRILAGITSINSIHGASMVASGAAKLITPVLTHSMTIRAVGVTTLLSSAAGMTVGLLMIGWGLFTAYGLYKKAKSLTYEPAIRKKLNEMMEVALANFKNQEYEKFIETLAAPYVPIDSPHEPPLIKFEKGKKIDINPILVVQQLLKHQFRPDGIAYLLNIMGEVLIRLRARKVILEEQTYSALNELAIKLFQEIYSSNALEEEASKLDELVKNAQLDKDKQENLLQKIWRRFLRWSVVKLIPREYLEAANQAPFTARLEEIRNIARMNFATCQILIGDDDNFNRAKAALSQVKASLSKKFQFFCAPELRMQALEDWLLALGIYDDTISEPIPSSRLALNEVIRIEELQRVQYVQVEEERISIQGFISVTEGTDLWDYVFHFLHEIKIRSRGEFADFVKQSYESEAELKTIMDKILEVEGHKQQCVLGVQEWCSSLLKATPFLNDWHLQVIAYLFRVEFHYSILHRKITDESVFETYGPPVRPPKHISIYRRIHLVVNNNTRSPVLALFVTHDSIDLHYNLEQARMETSIKKKVERFLRTASVCSENAESCDNMNHIMALSKWAEALRVYEEVRTFAPHEHQALLGHAKCLLKLHKYKSAENFLLEHKTILEKHLEFWTNLAIAQRRQFNKKTDAQFSITKALEIQPQSHAAKKQRRLIEGEIIAQKSLQYKYTYNLDTHCSRSSAEHPSYNILSIDGGGIRGILPAVWLCELERKTRRPIATMFDMISGTSTGGIIAAGLSMPLLSRPTLLHDRLSSLRLPETYQPQYRASDILELYRTKHSELFTANEFSFDGVLQPKYSDIGRRSLLNNYFQDIRMADALTDLLIPTVSLQTHAIYSFTKRQHENYRIFDAVMATSSAPTYFAPYNIKGQSFVDGGVQANNPTMEAYREATTKYGVQPGNVFVLSLGTGDYIPDPIHPDKCRTALFWYSQLTKPGKLIFDGPRSNLERHMRDLLQENYHRWQVWFEDPIKLDDCREETLQYLIDTAREYIEEMECSDNRNRLGLVIEHLVESKNSVQ